MGGGDKGIMKQGCFPKILEWNTSKGKNERKSIKLRSKVQIKKKNNWVSKREGRKSK